MSRIIRFAAVFGEAGDIVHKFGRRSLKMPVSAELVHLPYVLFRYRVEWTTLAGRPGKAEGLFTADLAQGLPMNVGRRTRIEVPASLRDGFSDFLPLATPDRPKAKVAVEAVEVQDDSILPAVLEAGEAIARGKNVFKYDLLRILGGLRFRKVAIHPLPEAKTLYYPFWLVYYRGRDRRMRFQVFDGITGERERGAVIRSIEMALLKKEGKIGSAEKGVGDASPRHS